MSPLLFYGGERLAAAATAAAGVLVVAAVVFTAEQDEDDDEENPLAIKATEQILQAHKGRPPFFRFHSIIWPAGWGVTTFGKGERSRLAAHTAGVPRAARYEKRGKDVCLSLVWFRF